MKKKIIIVFILLFLKTMPCFAEGWKFAGWYGGGCYPNVEFDPNIKDRDYLVSDVAGLWRSDDSAAHWRKVDSFPFGGLGKPVSRLILK